MRFLSCNFCRRNSLILYGILLSRPELSPISIKREGQFKLGWRRHEYGSEWYDYAGLERVRDFFTPIKRGWLQNNLFSKEGGWGTAILCAASAFADWPDRWKKHRGERAGGSSSGARYKVLGNWMLNTRAEGTSSAYTDTTGIRVPCPS